MPLLLLELLLSWVVTCCGWLVLMQVMLLMLVVVVLVRLLPVVVILMAPVLVKVMMTGGWVKACEMLVAGFVMMEVVAVASVVHALIAFTSS